jgi:hypothetical protein
MQPKMERTSSFCKRTGDAPRDSEDVLKRSLRFGEKKTAEDGCFREQKESIKFSQRCPSQNLLAMHEHLRLPCTHETRKETKLCMQEKIRVKCSANYALT